MGHKLEPDAACFCDMAQTAMVDAGSDRREATRLLIARVFDDATLRERLFYHVLTVAAETAVAALSLQQPKAVAAVVSMRPRVSVPTRPRADTIAGFRAVSQDMLLNVELSTGVRLGDAIRTQLEDEIDRHRADARASIAQAKWLRYIAQALPDNRTRVADQLSEADLARMQRDAERPSRAESAA